MVKTSKTVAANPKVIGSVWYIAGRRKAKLVACRGLQRCGTITDTIWEVECLDDAYKGKHLTMNARNLWPFNRAPVLREHTECPNCHKLRCRPKREGKKWVIVCGYCGNRRMQEARC
jgi:hypothetical protein